MSITSLKEKIKGIYVLAITPMKEDFSVDLDALRRNINHFIEKGAHGIIVSGNYAEFPSLSKEERKQVFAAAAEAVAGRVPLICCTAASGTDEAIELTKAAKEVGADAVKVTPPYVHEVETKDILYHFQKLNDAVDIPIFIYNIASIKRTLSPVEIRELAKLDKVVGVKQGGTDLREIVQSFAEVGDKISIMAGSDSIILGALASGLPGCTSTNANFMVHEYVALYNEMQSGQWDKARARYYRWKPIWDLARKYGQPAFVKAALDLVGLTGGAVRAPFQTLGDDARKEIKTVLKQLGIIA